MRPAPTDQRSARLHVILALVTAAVTAAALLNGPRLLGGEAGVGDSTAEPADRTGGAIHDLADQSEAYAAGLGTTDVEGVHTHADGSSHDHADPATRNDVSRSGEAATDPTTPERAAANRAGVEEGRAAPEPATTTVDLERPRLPVPEDVWAMARGCYTLQAPDGRYVVTGTSRGTGVSAGTTRASDATPFRFQATDLGVYLLYTLDERFAAAATNGGVRIADAPSQQAEWVAERGTDGRFTFTNLALDRRLAVTPTGASLTEPGTRFALRTATGCATYPEAEVNVDGDPLAGVTPYQEVRGYIDAHTHGMAFEFLGGAAHCGRPWHRYGIAYATRDCADHEATLGVATPLETVLSGRPYHDTTGWPTYRDFPAPDSLTHGGTYMTWMERNWRGGQRVLVNLLVENGQLCEIYPIRKPGYNCDDMDTIRRQAQRMVEFERYVDAQHGGPGRGWYRIVRTPAEARAVINGGRLAVVMGIETSVPFGCSMTLDVPHCDTAAIDAQLDEMYALGVRQMEIVNKFDNALSGVAGDEGAIGVAVNLGNFLETGTFWNMEHCEPADGESADRTQSTALPPQADGPQQDAIFGAVLEASGLLSLPALPIYPSPLHCNRRGLTDLGAHLVDAMADRGMLIDPDHMSVVGRSALLDQLEARAYPGVISSHSWSTPDAYPRIYALGGFVAPYAGDSVGFYEKWQRHLGWADPRYYFGFGYGADINGLGAQGNPRGADVDNPVTYPFAGFGGTVVDQQVSGERVYDLNVDGVAHYGLYPDWIEDLRLVATADAGPDQAAALLEDMARGPEAYLQTWERATGIAPDSCRNPELRLSVPELLNVAHRGASTQQVLEGAGQPYLRPGRSYVYCTEPVRGLDRVRVTFGPDGRVVATQQVRES